MKYVLLVLIGSLPLVSVAQKWAWAGAVGGDRVAGAIRMNQGTGINADEYGNVYVVGFFAGKGVFGNDTLNTYVNTDPLIVKYDSAGNVQWGRKITEGPTDYCYGMCLDRAQNVCITGVESGNFINGFTAKYDGRGDLVWIGESRCEDCTTYMRGIATDRVGNIYVTGDCKGVVDFDSFSIGAASKYTVFVMKYDVKGRILWVRQSVPSDNYYTQAHGLAMDAQGHLYMTGEFVDGLQFGGAEVSGRGEQDIFVARFNNEGKMEWLKSWGGKSIDRPRSIAVDDIGNFYLTAYFTSDPRIKGKTIEGENLMKFTAAGELVWNTQIGVADKDYLIASTVATGRDSGLYLTGKTYGMIPLFGDNAVTCNGANDIFIAKCNVNGVLLWKQQLGGSGVDEGSAISVDNDLNIYVTGYFHDQMQLGKIKIRSVSGDDGVWVGKMRQ